MPNVVEPGACATRKEGHMPEVVVEPEACRGAGRINVGCDGGVSRLGFWDCRGW
jgi:hypothetical protein